MALVDIVMLVHDQANWADLAIRAVEHHTRNSYRLIIVDSASVEQETKDMLAAAEKRGHTVVRLQENRSFSNGVNAGVGAGDSRFIVVLNDDAIVTEGWDTALLQDATTKEVGLVGARSNYAAGAQGDPGFIGEPKYLVAVCWCLRRDVWNQVGPMDEKNFDGFSGEDLDFSWTVLKRGYKLKVSSAYVLHAGSRTLVGTANGDAAQRQQQLARNNEKYVKVLQDKWGKEWFAEHTNLRKKILIATFHAEEWTRVAFMGAFTTLKTAGYVFQFYHSTRAHIQIARQLVADYALDKGFDVLVQLDDDAIFPPDLLPRLLRHEKDVVSALAYQRREPHMPCIYELGPDGLHGAVLSNYEHTGLRRVDVTGFHCSAISTSVFRKLREAGVTQFFGGYENKLGEDFAFCVNLKKAGIPAYCDTDLISGHIGSAVVVDESYKRAWDAQQAAKAARAATP